mgnify:CR=1 FL=1
MVEHYNCDLRDSLHSILLGTDLQDWDLLLPQIMSTMMAVTHSLTGETTNFLMLGREARLLDHQGQQST